MLSGRTACWVCAGLLGLFALLAWGAVSTKSATYDEVVHAPAAYSHLRHFDFRANPEHPPLWKYWAALPWLVSPPAGGSVTGPEFDAIPEDMSNQWAWGQHVLYHTPGNDAGHLVGMSRAMMLVVGVGMGAFLAWWGWRLGGGVAAVVTTTLFCLDPNFLAHSALVTNDVAFSFVAVGLAWALWRVGERLTVGRVMGVALLCGVGVTTKYTGVLMVPAVGLTLLARAVMREPWGMTRGRALGTVGRRVVAAGCVWLVTAVVTYGCVWAAYGFRFGMSPDPGLHPNVQQVVAEAAVNEIMGRTGHPATREQLHAWTPSVYVRAVLNGFRYRVLPVGFLNGLSFAYSKSLFRHAFLFGEVRGTGWWYYFPAAMLVKLPLATLAVVVGVPVALAGTGVARRGRGFGDGRWLAACLVIPAGVVAAASMRSHLNIGLRHFMPVYVFLYIGAGVIAARLMGRWPRATRGVLAVLAVGLAVESFAAFPNYIPFFNAAAGGARGGIRLLGDSNLDWGQDLPLLAQWQQEHPDRTLWLAYFGTADPGWYGIRGVRLTRDNGMEMPVRLPRTGVVAVSATTLQGIWVAEGAANPFAPLLTREPVAVLGGTIYVYDLGGQ